MHDVINQIIKMDSLAFENKKKNEAFLINKKQEYENTINNYSNEEISRARNRADTISKNMEDGLKNQEELYREKIEKTTKDLDAKYLSIESKLVKEIFEKLFLLEG